MCHRLGPPPLGHRRARVEDDARGPERLAPYQGVPDRRRRVDPGRLRGGAEVDEVRGVQEQRHPVLGEPLAEALVLPRVAGRRGPAARVADEALHDRRPDAAGVGEATGGESACGEDVRAHRGGLARGHVLEDLEGDDGAARPHAARATGWWSARCRGRWAARWVWYLKPIAPACPRPPRALRPFSVGHREQLRALGDVERHRVGRPAPVAVRLGGLRDHVAAGDGVAEDERDGDLGEQSPS